MSLTVIPSSFNPFCLPHQKMFTPPMPGDVMVNFYINLSKLCLTVYQLHVLPPNTTKVRTEPSEASHCIMGLMFNVCFSLW